MVDIVDAPGLLLTAIQDLHDAECAMVERLPAIARHAGDAGLVRLLTDDVAQSRDRARRLAGIARAMGEGPNGAPNIWLRSILDDADRDARTTAAGPLLDVALVGAIRKGKQAERVSYETAIALADALSRPADAQLLQSSRDEAAAMDSGLERLLYAIGCTLSSSAD